MPVRGARSGARLAMSMNATNDCAAASSGIETIEREDHQHDRLQRSFECSHRRLNDELAQELARSAARPRSGAERLGVDAHVDIDAPHLATRPEPARQPKVNLCVERCGCPRRAPPRDVVWLYAASRVRHNSGSRSSSISVWKELISIYLAATSNLTPAPASRFRRHFAFRISPISGPLPRPDGDAPGPSVRDNF